MKSPEQNTPQLEQRVDVELRFAQFKNLLIDVEEYNIEHGPSAKLGKALAAAIIDSVKVNKEATQILGDELAAQAAMEFAPLISKHKEALRIFGLSVVRPTSYQDPDETYDGASLYIQDVNAFLSATNSISVVSATENEKTFTELLRTVRGQIFFNNVNEMEKPNENLNKKVPDIVNALHDLIQGGDFETLDNYAKFAVNGRLRNYVAVDREHLWQVPGKGFGPADWVRDITPEGLEKKWNHALGILAIQELEKEGGVASELREHLLTCITSSFETIESTSWPETVKQQFKTILIKYTQQLVGNNTLN